MNGDACTHATYTHTHSTNYFQRMTNSCATISWLRLWKIGKAVSEKKRCLRKNFPSNFRHSPAFNHERAQPDANMYIYKMNTDPDTPQHQRNGMVDDFINAKFCWLHRKRQIISWKVFGYDINACMKLVSYVIIHHPIAIVYSFMLHKQLLRQKKNIENFNRTYNQIYKWNRLNIKQSERKWEKNFHEFSTNFTLIWYVMCVLYVSVEFSSFHTNYCPIPFSLARSLLFF